MRRTGQVRAGKAVGRAERGRAAAGVPTREGQGESGPDEG